MYSEISFVVKGLIQTFTLPYYKAPIEQLFNLVGNLVHVFNSL